MKKLMITAAAAMTAMVGFCTIESSNVVGYSQTQLGQNFTAGGAQFIPVSGSTIDLNQLSVTGYEEVSADEVYVQVLDSLGRGGVNYVWIDSPEDEALGWINTDTGDFAEDGELTIAPGDGLWINAPDSTFSLQTAGQVATGAIAVTLRQNFKLVVNPTPVSVDLNQIVVSGYEEVSADEVYVQVLDSLGRGGVNYVWIDSPEDEALGWINTDTGDFAEDGELTIGPGAGIWVNAPSADFVIEMPGVNLK